MPPTSITIPVRRVPLKSCNGCETCRARKVKCDETRPTCRRCAGYLKDPPPCVFDQQRPRNRTTRQSVSNVPSTQFVREPIRSLQTAVPNASNLTASPTARRLFYHYIQRLPDQLPQSQNAHIQKMWLIDVPLLSFEHDFLLSALLGISSLHIGVVHAHESPRWMDIAAYCFNRCLASFKTEVINIGPRNALPVLLTSYFVNALCSRLTRKSVATFHAPHREMRIVRSIRPLLSKCAAHLHPADLHAIMRPEAGTEHLPHHRWLKIEEAADLDGLLGGLDQDAPDYDIYKRQVDLLKRFQDAAITGAAQPFLARQVTAFVVEATDAYIDMLERHDPRALAIAAHHSAFAKFAASHWWLKGYPEIFTYGYANMLPADWQWAMVWPLWLVDRVEQPEIFHLPVSDVPLEPS